MTELETTLAEALRHIEGAASDQRVQRYEIRAAATEALRLYEQAKTQSAELPPQAGARIVNTTNQGTTMNIESLTFGELKQIAALFANATNPQPAQHPSGSIGNQMIGKYVIARCYSAGVHAGTVEAVDGENVILRDSRRLWAWKAADGVALSGVAQHGLKGGSKLDVVNPRIYLTGVCELIPVADGVGEAIHAYK